MIKSEGKRIFSDADRTALSLPPLPDILAEELAIVFCGINPGMRAAAAGHHFEGRGNRFWRVLHLAGFTPELMRPESDRDLLAYGYGLTTAVGRPTSRADQLSPQEVRDATSALLKKIESYRPVCIAFLGKLPYMAISGQRQLAWGNQNATFGGAQVWILPNPSGLNRSFGIDDLVRSYKELRQAMK